MPVAAVSIALAVDALYVYVLRGMVILAVAAVPMAIVVGAIYAFAITEPDVHRYIKLTSPETEFTSTLRNSEKRDNSDQPHPSHSYVDTATPLGKPSAVVNSSLRGAPLDEQLAMVLAREANLNATLGHLRTRASRLKRFLGRVEEYNRELQVVARATSWLRAAYVGLGRDSTEVAPDISATPAERQQAAARQPSLLHAASLQALACGTASMASAGRTMHGAAALQVAADAITAREAARQAAAAESAKAVLHEMNGQKDCSTSAGKLVAPAEFPTGREGGEVLVPPRRLLAAPLAAHTDADTLHEFTDVHADSPPRSPPLTSIADAAPTACWTVSAAAAPAAAAAAPAKPTMLTAHELRVLARAQGERTVSPRKGGALGLTCSTPLRPTCTTNPTPCSFPSDESRDERAVRAQEVPRKALPLPALPVLVRKATPGVKLKIKSSDIRFVHDPDLDSDAPLSIIAHATGARWRLPNEPNEPNEPTQHATGARWRLPNEPTQQDPSEAAPIRARITGRITPTSASASTSISASASGSPEWPGEDCSMCTPLPPSQPLYDQAEIPPPPPPRRNRNRRIIMLKLEPHQYSIIDDSAAAAGFGLENDAEGPSLVDRTPGQAWDGTLPRVEIPCVPISASPVDDVGTLAVDVGRLKIPQSHSAPELGWRLRPGDPRRRQMHWLDRQIRHDQALALEESPAPPRRAVSKVDPTEVGGRELQPWDRGWSLSAYLGVLAPQRRASHDGSFNRSRSFTKHKALAPATAPTQLATPAETAVRKTRLSFGRQGAFRPGVHFDRPTVGPRRGMSWGR